MAVVALAAGQTVLVENVLDGSDRVVEISLIEAAAPPVLFQLAEFMLGMAQAIALAAPKPPYVIAAISDRKSVV